jgi:hypothetical protein
LKRNNKKKNLSSNQIKDSFDIKNNLNKLKINSGFESVTGTNVNNNYSDNDFSNDNLTNETTISYLKERHNDVVSNIELELNLERLKSEFNECINNTEKDFVDKVEDFREKLGIQLDNKVSQTTFNWFLGIIFTSGVIIITLFLTLSYNHLIEDVETIEDTQNQIKIDIQEIKSGTKKPKDDKK